MNSEKLLEPLPHSKSGLKLTGIINIDPEKKQVEAWWNAFHAPPVYDFSKFKYQLGGNLAVAEIGTVEVVWRIPVDCPEAKSHYPNDPMIPGVSILEAMAQVWSRAKINAGNLKLVSIERIRFRESIRPGHKVKITVNCLRKDKDCYILEGNAYLGKKLATQATFCLSRHNCLTENEVPEYQFLESIAQAGSVMGYQELGQDVLLKLVEIVGAKFSNSVYNEDRLYVDVRCVHQKMHMLFLEGSAYVGSRLILSTKFSASSHKA